MEGFIPYEGDNIIKLDSSCRFAHMYGILREFPREYWIQTVDQYLNKILMQEIGTIPAKLERVSRFHSAVMHLREENEVHAALKAGYYDQSHMCKEFREFSVWTPSRIQDFMNTFINIAG